MSKPRTLTRLLVAGLALILAWQAQARVADPLSSDGWILYGIAIVLFVGALARVPWPQDAAGLAPEPAPASERLIYRQAFLLGVALLLGLMGFILFANPASQPAAWWLHGASLVVFLAAIIFGGTRPRPRADARRAGSGLQVVARSLLPVLAIVLVAAAARLWQIDQFPVGTWYDEAFNGNAAVQILRDPGFRPVFVDGDTLPAHFDYLLALSFQLFGVSTISMRFVTAAFGIATAVLAYLLFRRWFGPRLGFVAGMLFAVMRYDLTFSRIALHGVTTPFFELLVLFWFDRMLERRQLHDVAWLAVSLGIGLAFYTPFRLFPVVLLLFSAAWAARWLWQRSRGGAAAAADGPPGNRVRPWAPYIIVLLLGLFVSTVPITEFALQNRDVFFARTNSVSIFEQRDQPDLVKALWSNFSKHMLMFNVLGDRNGRHNLPNEPELDPIMGALAVLGFALALWRWRERANLLMLLVFFIMNLGGILSVDFEAPQSLRSIGVMPALIYFAALPLAALGWELARVFRLPAATQARGDARAPTAPYGIMGGAQAAFNLLLLAVVAASAYANLDIFYNRQAKSPDVWASYSTAETLVAQQMKQLAPDYDLVVTSLFANHPVLRFIAPEVTNYAKWSVNDRLPLVRAAGRPVALLLDPLLASTVDAARRYYPTAAYKEFPPPNGGSPAMFRVLLSERDLLSVSGLEASYLAGDGSSDLALRTEAVPALNVDWTAAAPVTGTFTAEFRGTLDIVEYGAYGLRLDGAPDALLWVDENPAGSAPLMLAKGLHAFRARVPGGARRIVLLWQPPDAGEWLPVPASVLFRPPVTNSGLLGAYYPSPDWTGAPAFTQVDPEVSLYFHNLPLPRPYSVQWTGKLFAPIAGTYKIATESIDESQVWINSRVVVTNRGSTTSEGSIQLPQGWNDIVVRFADHTGHTHIYLSWTQPSGQREIIPSRYLSPPMGKYPTAAEVAAQPKPLPLPALPGAGPSAGPTPAPAGTFNMAWQLALGEAGNGPLQFNEPHGLAIGADGSIFVADTGNRRVEAIDPAGRFRFSLDGGDQPFVEPFDVAAASDGELIVLDSDQGWLYRFDADGNMLGRFGGPSEQFYHPRGLSIDAQDNLYVSDTGGSRVVKLTLAGRRVQVYGTRGNGPGQFVEPTSAVLDPSGYLFATDVPNHRILSFTADGRFVLDFQITAAGTYNGPRLAFASDQTLLVTAPERNTLQRYARDGTLLGEWGGLGGLSGQFRLPTGIASRGDVVWIADTGNNRVQKWMVQAGP